jgi:hypothetical protein
MSRILERGDAFCFYRPRVETEEVHTLDDVQRFFFVMRPDGKRIFRRVVIGRKRFPEVASRERDWAFVAQVAERPDELHEEIEPATYETKTRGERYQPPARPAGELRYALVDHDGHTHFAYVLELPREPGPAQRLFNIAAEASYVVAVRNPEAPSPPWAGLDPRQRAELPPELGGRFDSRRFVPLNPPEFLDHEGVEIVLIGASHEADEELGIEFDAEAERLEDADIFRELRLDRRKVPVEPLERGELE